LRDLGRRGLARADGPYGLIRNNDLCKLLWGKRGNSVSELLLENRVRGSRFALFKALANADDRPESAFHCGLRTLQHGLVGLTEILPPLTVADQYPLNANRDQHRTGDLAGVRSFLLPIQILRADLYTGSLRRLHRRCQVDEAGQITMSRSFVFSMSGQKFSKKADVSETVLCIFQLPAIKGVRMMGGQSQFNWRATMIM
jgi:hypothetical protein